MDQKKSVPFDRLLKAVALGNVEPEVLSSVAARLARLDRELTEPDKLKIMQASGGYSLKDLARGIVEALPCRKTRAAIVTPTTDLKRVCRKGLRYRTYWPRYTWRMLINLCEPWAWRTTANCDVKSGQVVRAKLGLKDADVADAVAWARNSEKPAAKA